MIQRLLKSRLISLPAYDRTDTTALSCPLKFSQNTEKIYCVGIKYLQVSYRSEASVFVLAACPTPPHPAPPRPFVAAVIISPSLHSPVVVDVASLLSMSPHLAVVIALPSSSSSCCCHHRHRHCHPRLPPSSLPWPSRRRRRLWLALVRGPAAAVLSL